MLSEKEATLLYQIANNSQTLSQKSLSQKTGLSVGLINTVLKKMIHKGYVKAKAINKKKMHYLLTPKGSSRIIRKTYNSIVNTIRHYQQLESKIKLILIHISQNTGKNKFVINGSGELAEIVERVIQQQLEPHIEPHIQLCKKSTNNNDCLTLNLTNKNREQGSNLINLLHYLNSQKILSKKNREWFRGAY